MKHFQKAPCPKTPTNGLNAPPDPPAPFTLAAFAFLLIMCTPGIMSVFYLSLFPARSSDTHPGHNKTASIISSADKSNI